MASASNSRVIEIINFLAAHPTETFTLSELAEKLSLSHGSAHRALNTLTEARYLSRHPKHKTYSLGAALLAVGEATLEKHHAVKVARGEMARLAVELEVQCIASIVVDDELLLVAREGVSRTPTGLSRVGERRPFIPPTGLGHIAWATTAEHQRYVDSSQGALSQEQQQHLQTALAIIRQRGFAAASVGAGLAALRQVVNEHTNRYRSEDYWTAMREKVASLATNEIQLLTLEDLGEEQLGYISVPVFAPDGSVALELSLTGLPLELNQRQVKHYINRLKSTAAVVTNETHGKPPL